MRGKAPRARDRLAEAVRPRPGTSGAPRFLPATSSVLPWPRAFCTSPTSCFSTSRQTDKRHRPFRPDRLLAHYHRACQGRRDHCRHHPALLFGYGATYDLPHVPYAVLDQSRGAVSGELLARLDGTGVFERTATLTSSDQIAAQIDSSEVLLVISTPSDFETRLAAGGQAPLQLILDGRDSSTAGLASAYVGAVVSA